MLGIFDGFLLFLIFLLFACLTFANISVIFMDRISSTKDIPYVNDVKFKYAWYGIQYIVLIVFSVYNYYNGDKNTTMYFTSKYNINKRSARFIFIILYAIYLLHIPYIALMLMHNKDHQITYIDTKYSPYNLNLDDNTKTDWQNLKQGWPYFPFLIINILLMAVVAGEDNEYGEGNLVRYIGLFIIIPCFIIFHITLTGGLFS
jgi:hypothetical protein